MALHSSKIKKSDLVKVITGKDAGKTGKVLFIDRQHQRVVVEKINIVKKHQKQQRGKGGGIVEKEISIHLSNVMLMNEKLGQPVRIKAKLDKEGKKQRICAKSGEALDQETKKK